MFPINPDKAEIQRLNYESYHYPDAMVQYYWTLMEIHKEKILYAKYYETPTLFHHAITGFFQTINQEYNDDLKNLLTLKFQFFENQSAEIYPK